MQQETHPYYGYLLKHNIWSNQMKIKSIIGTTLLATAFSAQVFAGADCPEHPQDSWIPEAQMKEKIVEMGYTIDLFKIDDHCYEIYGKNTNGEKVEVYFNPVTAEIVEEELKD